MSGPSFCPLDPAVLDATVAMQCRAMAVLGRSHYDAGQIDLLLAATRDPDYATALFGNDVWVAVAGDGAIVGSAGWGAVSGTAPPRGRIRKVFVEPGIAGRGLGRHLVEAAEARAEAAGVRGFVVRANLNAVRFYERLGYRVTGPGDMAVGDRRVPMTMMEKPAQTAG